MPDLNDLACRIDAELSAVAAIVEKRPAEPAQDARRRRQQMERLTVVFERLREVWKPRLELLVGKLGTRVQATGHIVPTNREATIELQTGLARVRLRFSALTDRDVTTLVLCYDLEIVPTVTRFDSHAELEVPLDAVDVDTVARWIDDRIVQFVQTYATLVENETYLKDYMVEDPIARVRFPTEAAAASVEWDGKRHYFITDDSRREFERQHGIGAT
jgi:YHS domain-containing protein